MSRIMSDVEGVRNLIGTGLVEFLGGLLTATIALVLLLRISPLMTGVAFALLLVKHAFLAQGVQGERSGRSSASVREITAEVSGRLTESRFREVRVVEGLPCRDAGSTKSLRTAFSACSTTYSALADDHVDDETFRRRRCWASPVAWSC